MLTVEELEREMRQAARARVAQPAQPAQAPMRSIEALCALRPVPAAEGQKGVADAASCPPELRGLFDRSSAELVKWHPHSSYESPMRSGHTSGGGSLAVTPPRGVPVAGRHASSPLAGATSFGSCSSPCSAHSAPAHPGHMMLPPSVNAAGAARITVGIDASKSTTELERILGSMAVTGSSPPTRSYGGGGAPRGTGGADGSGPWSRSSHSPPQPPQHPASASRAVPSAPLPTAGSAGQRPPVQPGATGMGGGVPRQAMPHGATTAGGQGATSTAAGGSAAAPSAPVNLSAWFGNAQLLPGGGQSGGPQHPPEGEALTLEELERQMARGRGA